MIYRTISPTESQVGKYVDINGNGIPEGVIFADLAIGGKCQYRDRGKNKANFYEVEIQTLKEGLKDYIVIGEFEDKINGKQEILAPILDGNNRFYIMALQDAIPYNREWYDSAGYSKIHDYDTLTHKWFGAGYSNTVTMMKKWTNEEFGIKNGGIQGDVWREIQEDVKNGWFIPSKDEWAIIAANLKISSTNYESKGLKTSYWSSSIFDTYRVYTINFWFTYINNDGFFDDHAIRLITTY